MCIRDSINAEYGAAFPSNGLMARPLGVTVRQDQGTRYQPELNAFNCHFHSVGHVDPRSPAAASFHLRTPAQVRASEAVRDENSRTNQSLSDWCNRRDEENAEAELGRRDWDAHNAEQDKNVGSQVAYGTEAQAGAQIRLMQWRRGRPYHLSLIHI
eukprot:TRINITY_DN7767_c0_g1_i3.p2 TRINITY_DN7767_c0_g1~~TRINITY_DN7767_c0_g1_i3.p2  ORF type:complete len:156 (-),score=32.51 TRINITY_DN7767_c0_g1_i3:142-609(-)